MICTRCQGLITEEKLRDWDGVTGSDWSFAFRCLPCGDIIDPVIFANARAVAGRPHLLSRARDVVPE